jgi:argininosuccinate synthase
MKIVLAYSGGLDTSVIVKWLKETYDAEIVTFAADVGQEEELKGLDKKALKTGASKHYTLDLVEEFARDFIYPMVRGTVLSRNFDCASADREGAGRYREKGKSRHGGSWCHGQGE